MMKTTTLVLLASLLASSVAWAEPEAPTPPPTAASTAEAKKLFVSGTRHFDLAEYNEALDDFRHAFRLRDDPVFLYNIAQCYRLLDKPDEAEKFYRTYLRRAPQAKNRDEVEAKIRTLQEVIAKQEAARAAAAAAKPEPAPPPVVVTPVVTEPLTVATAPPQKKTPVYKKWWLWTTVGVVAVGLGVGLGVGLTRSSGPTTFPRLSF